MTAAMRACPYTRSASSVGGPQAPFIRFRAKAHSRLLYFVAAWQYELLALRNAVYRVLWPVIAGSLKMPNLAGACSLVRALIGFSVIYCPHRWSNNLAHTPFHAKRSILRYSYALWASILLNRFEKLCFTKIACTFEETFQNVLCASYIGIVYTLFHAYRTSGG